jgi:hypothetical protein
MWLSQNHSIKHACLTHRKVGTDCTVKKNLRLISVNSTPHCDAVTNAVACSSGSSVSPQDAVAEHGGGIIKIKRSSNLDITASQQDQRS